MFITVVLYLFEAETEEEALEEFDRKYFDYGDVDQIEDVTEEWADWEK